ncbi:hypothetical protein BZG36_01242 [Bifiguratus adelaidae]|uniref:Uncharacterized protein n=1 Tax=Bifiguratus adelaidae TaxID=1938954 RepID=A0A261Y5N5_9FUNG|nr:hypothetical protein BZG36_01242 [Bifiguratus adelaidae]
MDVNVERYRVRITNIVKVADLSQISAKRIRRQLEQEDGLSLEPVKRALDDLIVSICSDLIQAKNEQSPSPPPAPPVQRRSKPSPPKPKRGPSPSSESEVGDEALARQLDREWNAKRTRHQPIKKEKKKRMVVQPQVDVDGKVIKRNTGFNKPMVLSAELSAFTGATEMSRPEVVKKLWEHIKTQNLQDPSDRRMLINDGPFKQLFGRDRMSSFEMNKFLSPHLKRKEDLADT